MSEHPNFLEFAICDTCAAETMCHETGANEHQCGSCYWAPISKASHQSELAALREELATANDENQQMATVLEYKNRRLTAAEQRNAELRQELAMLHAIKETPGENILWDVLNATVGIITRRAYPHALESEAHNAGAKVILDRRAGLAATHLKPTESGETE